MSVRPKLVICDLSMPGLHGLDLTQSVRSSCPATQVVILSVHADEPYLLRALELGASGYVLKSASAGHLLIAIRAAVRGELRPVRRANESLSDRRRLLDWGGG